MFTHWLRSLRRLSGLAESSIRRRRGGKMLRLRPLEVERLEDRWVPSGNVVLSPAALPADTIGVAYNNAFTASGAVNTFYANQVVSYVPGAIPDATYDNPAAALGGLDPLTGTFDGTSYYLTPFDPAFSSSDLVEVGAGGSLILKLAQTASTDGTTIGVHTGFGLADANYPSGTNTNPATYSNDWLRQADVQVSADGIYWFNLGTITFDNPSNYYAGSTTDPEGLSPGVGPLANPGQPFLGSLSSFNGLNWQGTLAALNGSAGGTWLNLSGVPLTGVNYIEFSVPAGNPELMMVDAVVGTNSTSSIAANGGTGDVNLAVSNVQNPIAGLDIPASGTNSLPIAGTPTAPGTETFTVTATDAAGDTTTTNESITVNPLLSLPASLPADTVNVSYNQTITPAGGTGTITLAVSNIQNAIPGLSVPSTSTNGLTITGTPTATGTETFTVTATDAVGITTTANYSITVNPQIVLADLPALQLPGAQSVLDNTTLVFSTANGNAITVSDPGATSSTVETLYLQDFYGTLQAANTAGLSSIAGNGTALVTMTGTLTALNAALDGLSYAPPPFTYNFAEPLSATLVAPNNTSASASVAIDVTFASRAPAVPGLQSVLSNSTLTFASSNGNGIALTDPLAGSTDVETVYVQTLWGTLYVPVAEPLFAPNGNPPISGNDTSLVTLTGSLAELNSDLNGLIYTPAAFTYGYSDTLDVMLQATDGPVTSAVPISVLHVNETPTVTLPGAQSVNTGATLAFSPANGNAIAVGDADANGGRETVTLEATAGSGSLTLHSTAGLSSVSGNGSALVGLTGTLAQLNTALAGLSFTAAGSFQGPALLSVLIDDNGNSGVSPSNPFAGAAGALSASGSIAINVAAVVTPPGASISGPTSQAIVGTDPVAFSPGINVSDPDANGAIETLTLQALTGSLSVLPTGGLTSSSGSGTKSLTLEGTIAALNTALQTLEYQAQSGATTDFVSAMLVAPNGTGSETATLGISLAIAVTTVPAG